MSFDLEVKGVSEGDNDLDEDRIDEDLARNNDAYDLAAKERSSFEAELLVVGKREDEARRAGNDAGAKAAKKDYIAIKKEIKAIPAALDALLAEKRRLLELRDRARAAALKRAIENPSKRYRALSTRAAPARGPGYASLSHLEDDDDP
jgi:hypothetical protein